MQWCLLSILLVCTSASLRAQSSKRRCLDTPIDSTNPSSPVYRECHVERKAKVRSVGPRPQFTPNTVGPTSCYRATFEFVVDTTGKPELATARRVSSSDQSYADAIEASLGGLFYEPARLGASLVRQVVRYDSRLAITRTVVVSTSANGALSPPSATATPRRPIC